MPSAYALSEDNAAYCRWRQNIDVEYICRTGRAFPSIRTEQRRLLCLALVTMSNREWPPNPIHAVDELISRGLLPCC